MKIKSHNVEHHTRQTLEVAMTSDAEENRRRRRQLLFMARLTHPESTQADIVTVELGDRTVYAIGVGASMHGMDHIDGDRYVEDLVD